ncbi:hypothetical protein B0H14DRAFT_3516531 [Mycena olivaceomarginata]|nr:hypothetical protein B0H14DRAFT_3516531 [Mycena olivaceomarginata]
MICSVPSRCSNVAPSALVAAIATAQLRPTSRRHPGSPFTAALAARPSLSSSERAAKREDPYLVNIASTCRLATLPRLITLPRVRRQDVKDRQGCYLLAALATFGIAFASAIAGHLPYLRRPSATRPPPLTKSPKFANNRVACPASCSITCLSPLSMPPHSGSSRLLPPPRPHMHHFHILHVPLVLFVATRPLTPPLAGSHEPSPLLLYLCYLFAYWSVSKLPPPSNKRHWK